VSERGRATLATGRGYNFKNRSSLLSGPERLTGDKLKSPFVNPSKPRQDRLTSALFPRARKTV